MLQEKIHGCFLGCEAVQSIKCKRANNYGTCLQSAWGHLQEWDKHHV